MSGGGSGAAGNSSSHLGGWALGEGECSALQRRLSAWLAGFGLGAGSRRHAQDIRLGGGSGSTTSFGCSAGSCTSEKKEEGLCPSTAGVALAACSNQDLSVAFALAQAAFISSHDPKFLPDLNILRFCIGAASKEEIVDVSFGFSDGFFRLFSDNLRSCWTYGS